MAQVINTNVMSLNAQRNLSSSGSSLATSIQRLSSGLRINSAKDDAAGLAISERFTSQIRGLDQSVRNANDGISLAQTAEGALSEIGNNLQRIRELAVQASNGTNSQTDRDALNKEVTQLKAEIQRVSEQTNFNGTKLLDGSFKSVAFQVGANSGETISISSIANAQVAQLGGVTNRFTANVDSGDITDLDAQVAGALTINGIDVGAIDAAANSQERAGQVVEAINRVSSQSKVSASYNSTTGEITLTSATTFTVAGTGAADALGVIGATATAASETGIADLNVSGFASAQMAIDQIDNALKEVNTARADLGAIQNRFSSVVTNLQTSSENMAASRSRIRDTDYAKETAELTRNQILQQAGTAMLAQANSSSQSVLSLLQ